MAKLRWEGFDYVSMNAYMNIYEYINYNIISSFFGIPMEGIGFRNAQSKQRLLSLHLVPLKHLAERWGLSWHSPPLWVPLFPLPGHFIPHPIRF